MEEYIRGFPDSITAKFTGPKSLVEKYRAIFDGDVPEIDQNVADKLILMEMRKALEAIEKELFDVVSGFEALSSESHGTTR